MAEVNVSATTSVDTSDKAATTLPGDVPTRSGGWLASVLGWIRPIMSWVPLILALAVPDFRVALSCAFGVAVFNFGLSWLLQKVGLNEGGVRFPAILDCIMMTVFGALVVLVWADGARQDVYQAWAGFLINGGLALGTAVAWLCFRAPFVRDYTSAHFDDAGMAHPLVRHLVRVLTGWWLAVFVGMALVTLVGGLATDPPPSDLFVKAFQFPGFVTFVVLGVGWVGNWYYPIHWQKNWDKIQDRYHSKVEAWVADNPDHELAQYFEPKQLHQQEEGQQA